MALTPFEKIKKDISKELPAELVEKIPDKWEKVGDVGVIKLNSQLKNYSNKIGEIYAEYLNCKTILNDVGGIKGLFREPYIEIIYGSDNTETIHKENRIRFKLDPQKIMFSSCNMDERIHMASVSNENETVVDLFAGIGYFSIPIAVFSKPKKIFSCEINQVAYNYLCENIVLNDVTGIVEPIKGDSKEVAPKDVADRVILGYIGNTYSFLTTALDCLRGNKGIIHYHDKFPDKKIPEKPIKEIEVICKKLNYECKLLEYRKVKSYAPGISHYAFDFGIDRK
jgi:tRNA wybutosine-synthesizing protein 2